ncbi:MAG: tRNA (adenosine(37)-N6)-dimethylallyltransferase MiaA [bacterium]
MERYPLLVILGPTAVGKTELSVKLAKNLNGEIISADSMQIYRKMDIGTAKVSNDVQKEIKHHMIDIINPDKKYSVAEYKSKVDKIIPEIYDKGKLPIMVGGTGLYIKAVVRGFLFPKMKSNQKLRKNLEDKAKKEGNQAVHDLLAEVDPSLAEKLHPNDLRRVIRGIEVYRETGKTITYFKKKQKEKQDRYNTLKIGLTRNREELYARVNKRVDIMIEEGLINEVNDLKDNGYDLSSTALQGLGYKEIIDYLEGKYDKKEAIRVLKRNTRHFAKRQFTWFKRDDTINWYNLSKLNYRQAYNDILEKVNKFIENNFKISG